MPNIQLKSWNIEVELRLHMDVMYAAPCLLRDTGQTIMRHDGGAKLFAQWATA